MTKISVVSVLALAVALGSALDARAQTTDWIRQFGSTAADIAQAPAVSADGSIYVVGEAGAALPGQTYAGGFQDVYIRKYDASGTELWTRQFGTINRDNAVGVAVDASGVYIIGVAGAALPGQIFLGEFDAFVRKYDTSGNELWTRQFGTANWDVGIAAFADASGVYVVGYTNGALPGQTSFGDRDAFVRKYDTSGNELWTRQFGTTAGDFGFGISGDTSGVYVVGSTLGVLPGQVSAGNADDFIRKYDSSGNELWTRQFGSPGADDIYSVFAHASGVYVTGDASGALPGQTFFGNRDAFVRKYDALGNELWTRQFGTALGDTTLGVAVDDSGAYVSGYTQGALPGQTSAGGIDAFVRAYDASGNELWTRQFGGAPGDFGLNGDFAHRIALTPTELYVSGRTEGIFSGQTSAGNSDAFLMNISIPGGTPDSDSDGVKDDIEQALTGSATGLTVSALGVSVLGAVLNPDGTITFSDGALELFKLPAGAVVPGGTLTIDDRPVSGRGALKITGVVLPIGTTKTARVADLRGNANRMCIVDKPTGVDLSEVSTGCGTNIGSSRVRQNCDGIPATYSGFPDAPTMRTYTCTDEGSTYLVTGLAFSGVVEFPDADDDGVVDDADMCPATPGVDGYLGCPFADKTNVTLHIVDQQKSGVCGVTPDGKPRGECKQPLAGAVVKVFDREDVGFIVAYGSKRPPKALLGTIYESDLGKMGQCTTDVNGTCVIGEDHAGKFLVIVKHVDGAQNVYFGKFKNFRFKGGMNEAEEDDNDVDESAPRGTQLTKNLRLTLVVKNDGTHEYHAGTMTKIIGSELDIVRPEFSIWSSAETWYPFILTSHDTWTVDVCMNVPAGYKIVGIINGEGILTENIDCVQSFVNDETKTLLFNVVDVGSPEPKFDMMLTTKHKGKTAKHTAVLDGIRKAAMNDEIEGAKARVTWYKQEMERRRRLSLAGASGVNVPVLQTFTSPWKSIKAFFGF